MKFPKKLSNKLFTMLLMGARQGGYDEALLFIEEYLTANEYKIADGFLKWIVKNGYTFGDGNLDQKYKEFVCRGN